MMFKVQELCSKIGAQVANEKWVAALQSQLRLTGLATLKEAGPSDVAFFFSKNYQNDLLQSKAGVIVTGNAFLGPLEASGIPQWKNSVFIACEDPYQAMARLSGEFSKHLSAHDHQTPPSTTRIHASAVIDETVKMGENVEIGAGVVIEAGVEIDDGVVIYPQCYVGPRCRIGKHTVLFPRVTLYEKTEIGARCRIHSGVVIGGDGFGYAQVLDPSTRMPVDHAKIYHVGNVVIEDDVEVGANSTIDRGTLGSTRVRRKVKIDNQVQVGHNCDVGEGSVLCGCSGMAGSSSLGKFVVLGAQSGTSNQVHVGDYSRLSAFTGVAKDTAPRSELGGVPARPITDLFRIMAIQNRLLKERGRK